MIVKHNISSNKFLVSTRSKQKPKEKAMQQLEEFVQHQLELVSLERQEEMAAEEDLLKSSARALQDKGLALHKVYLANQSTGMYGRRVLEFETYQKSKDLPSHSIASGDIVGVFHSQQQQQQQQIVSGIVTKVLSRSIYVAVEPDQLISGGDSTQMDIGCRFSVVKLGSDVTFKRLKKGLLALLRSPPPLADLLLGERSLGPTRDLPAEPTESGANKIVYFNPNLDESQRAAVELGLRRSDLVMIHGPPGTGKTTTLVELVRQLVARGERLLCCAPSNTAVDNLAERLIAAGIRCVRLGHPARQLPQVAEHSLDALLARSEDRRIIADVRADIDKLLSGGGGKGHRRDRRIGAELSHLRSELRQREANCVKAILSRAQAVLCTLTVGGLNDDSTLKEIQFNATVIDECSQATEAACWLALPRAPKCILAGDPYQLPPTIKSERAVAGGYAITLMERLLPTSGEATHLLTVQYRMHEDIMRWSSTAFYSDRLVAHKTVARHRLADLPSLAAVAMATQRDASSNVAEDEEFPPLLLIDTTGCDLAELNNEDSEMSKANPGEAAIVAEHVAALVESGLDPSDIAVISPYNLQVETIRLALIEQQQNRPGTSSEASKPAGNLPLHRVEVRSVDGFQGREKEAVVISLVRSNRKGIVGFLAEHRRLNVAVTRARRHLCIVGDCDTVRRGDSVLAGFVDYLLANAKVRSASEFAHILDDMAIPSKASTTTDKQQQQQKKGQQKRGNKKQQKQENDAKELRLQQLLTIVRLFAKSETPALTDTGLSETLGVTFVPAGDPHSLDAGPGLRFVGLNPYERARLHEECETLGLQHRSIDDDEIDGARVLLISLSKKTAASVAATPADLKLIDISAIDSVKSTSTAIDVSATVGSKEPSIATNDVTTVSKDATAVAKEITTVANDPTAVAKEITTVAKGATTVAIAVESVSKSSKKVAKDAKSVADQAKPVASDSTNVTKDTATVAKDAPSCPVCGKPVPPGNTDLHRLACERAIRNRQLRAAVEGATAAVNDIVQGAGSQKSKNKTGGIVLGVGSNPKAKASASTASSEAAMDSNNKKLPKQAKARQAGAAKDKEKPQTEKEEDFDSLLAEFVAMDSTCGQPGCSTPVRTVGHACSHCRRRYCFSHFVPETHGCGQAARDAARRGASTGSSAVFQPKSNKEAIRRAHLQRRLETKLDDLEQARRPADQQEQKQKKKK